MKKELYNLPNLPYGYKDLEPHMSEEVVTLHHTKHHQAYVNTANALLEKLWEGRENNTDVDMKSTLKALSFNVGGHVLHETFWKTMAPASSGKNVPSGKIAEEIDQNFGSFDRLKKEFSEAATSVEGSGWAVLAFHKEHGNLAIIQVEKHNVNLYPEQDVLLALDVWEHAYYLDYKNDKAAFVENWWNIVNWEEAGRRMHEA